MNTNKLFLVILFNISSFFNYAQTVAWGNAYDATDGFDITLDNVGNAYSIGTFGGISTGVFGSYTLNCSGVEDIYLIKTNSSGVIKWAKGFGGPDADFGNSISSDGGANVYAAGSYSGTAFFGTYSLTSASINAFVCKIDSNGNVLWAKSCGNGLCEAYAIQAGTAGSTYVAGIFKNTCLFGTYTLTSAGGFDNFVAKLDNNGNVIWAIRTGGTFDDSNQSITIDKYGSLYVAGCFKGTSSFGPYFLNSSGGYDSFVAKINSTGVVLWAKKFGGISDDFEAAVSANTSGDVYIGSNYTPPVTLGTTTFTSGNSFIHKIDTSGNVIWANKFESVTGQCSVASISCDNSGNIYSTGSFNGGICSFGTSSLSAAVLNSNPFGPGDGYISMLDGAGNFGWVKKLDGPGSAGGKAIEYKSGKIGVTGYFSNTLNIDSYSISATFSLGTYPFALELKDDQVGIKENIKVLNVFVYPNPANDKLIIELTENAEELYYSLTDVTGKEVIHKKRIVSKESIDVSHYSKGVYFLQMETKSQTAMRKIVIE